MINIGEQVRKIRKSKGIKQCELAERIGVFPQYLGRIELGTRNPKLETLLKIANALNVPIEALYSDEYTVINEEDGPLCVIELLPCPFCGDKAHLFVNEGVRVICPKCGAASKTLVDEMTSTGSTGNAVKSVVNAWNRRTRQCPT